MRSQFEVDMAEVLEPAGFTYEPFKMDYNIPATYTPDFVMRDVMVECKGWFRPGDTRKYLAIKRCSPFHLVFLLQNPDKKVRKGNKITMSEWCDKEGIPWFDDPEELVQYVLDNR